MRPRLEHVWAVRQLVEAHYGPILRDQGLLDRLSVTAHELLENAAKYGTDGLSSLQVEIVPGSTARMLHVAVRNPIHHENVRVLKLFFEDMARAADPLAFYHARMERAWKLKDVSGLGLARISFEAEMTLSMNVDDQHVSLVAVAPIPDAEATP